AISSRPLIFFVSRALHTFFLHFCLYYYRALRDLHSFPTRRSSDLLSLALSRSYGPGRYDPQYEENGIDYPIGYVRWTEQRNMDAFLDLLSTGQINVDPLLEHQYAIDDGATAYADLKSGLYTAILKYNCASAVPEKAVPNVVPARHPIGDEVRIGSIGAGSFASSVLIPNLRAIPGVRLESVGTISGAGAASARRAFKFQTAQQPSELLKDPNVDAVFILTRHG